MINAFIFVGFFASSFPLFFLFMGDRGERTIEVYPRGDRFDGQ